MPIPLHRLRPVMTALALLLSATAAQAVTCEEVRALSPTELAHWAERLQVSPKYLAQLLEKAFCEMKSSRDPVIAPVHRRHCTKPL
jgi:hypothetical protein